MIVIITKLIFYFRAQVLVPSISNAISE